MKKIKFSLAAMGIAIGALGAFAFSPANNVSEGKTTGNWYLPLDSEMDASDPGRLDFANYDPNSAHENTSGCNNANIFVCAAEFPDTGQPATIVRTRD